MLGFVCKGSTTAAIEQPAALLFFPRVSPRVAPHTPKGLTARVAPNEGCRAAGRGEAMRMDEGPPPRPLLKEERQTRNKPAFVGFWDSSQPILRPIEQVID